MATGEGQGQEVGNVAVKTREGEVQERVNLAVNHDQKARVDLKHTVDPEVGHQMRIWMAQRKGQHQGHTVGAGQRVDQIDDETLDYCFVTLRRLTPKYVWLSKEITIVVPFNLLM